MVVVPVVPVKKPTPLAVKLVVEAPPFAEKSPEVIVELASERKPLVKVARPVWVTVPFTVSEPNVAVCAKRFVELAVVEKKLVVVPETRESVPSDEKPVTLKVGACRPLKKVEVPV